MIVNDSTTNISDNNYYISNDVSNINNTNYNIKCYISEVLYQLLYDSNNDMYVSYYM